MLLYYRVKFDCTKLSPNVQSCCERFKVKFNKTYMSLFVEFILCKLGQ